MNAFPPSISPSLGDLLVYSFTGIVPTACDAEAGAPEEVVLYWTALPPGVRLDYREPDSFKYSLRSSIKHCVIQSGCTSLGDRGPFSRRR